jgi:hypothetical protein
MSINRAFKVLLISVITLVGVIRIADGHYFADPASSKTLYDLAREKGKNGKYVHTIDVTGGITYPNIEEIAKRSDAIVIGRVVRQRSYLSRDGMMITTRHWIRPQEVVKGKITTKGTVVVSIPGGLHMYKDRTSVFVHSRYYALPRKDKIYAFFLKQNTNDPKEWSLVGGSQGQYGLDLLNNKVEPGEFKKNAAIRVKYKNMAAIQFLKEIHRVARISR